MMRPPGAASPRPSTRGRTVVAVLLAVDVIVLVPLGLVVIWIAVASDNPDWDALDRALLLALGLVETAMMSGLAIGIYRFHVLGRPSVRTEITGLRIGTDRLFWADVRDVGAVAAYGVPYLLLDVLPEARGRLPLSARIAARTNPPLAGGRRPLWITEQMLGTTVEAALDSILPALAARPSAPLRTLDPRR
jgi:hypothetical protein